VTRVSASRSTVPAKPRLTPRARTRPACAGLRATFVGAPEESKGSSDRERKRSGNAAEHEQAKGSALPRTRLPLGNHVPLPRQCPIGRYCFNIKNQATIIF
jgi:hypothetical protein